MKGMDWPQNRRSEEKRDTDEPRRVQRVTKNGMKKFASFSAASHPTESPFRPGIMGYSDEPVFPRDFGFRLLSSVFERMETVFVPDKKSRPLRSGRLFFIDVTDYFWATFGRTRPFMLVLTE